MLLLVVVVGGGGCGGLGVGAVAVAAVGVQFVISPPRLVNPQSVGPSKNQGATHAVLNISPMCAGVFSRYVTEKIMWKSHFYVPGESFVS